MEGDLNAKDIHYAFAAPSSFSPPRQQSSAFSHTTKKKMKKKKLSEKMRNASYFSFLFSFLFTRTLSCVECAFFVQSWQKKSIFPPSLAHIRLCWFFFHILPLSFIFRVFVSERVSERKRRRKKNATWEGHRNVMRKCVLCICHPPAQKSVECDAFRKQSSIYIYLYRNIIYVPPCSNKVYGRGGCCISAT
jgi:hypothetical protein